MGLAASLLRARSEFVAALAHLRDGSAGGSFGIYQGHGGGRDQGFDGLDTFMSAVPSLIEAAVVVNSSQKTMGGHQPVAHRCSVLKWAHEGAWVAS